MSPTVPPLAAEDSSLNGPRSPLRSLGILHVLALAPEGLTLSRLSEELTAPKTSVLALLRALQHGGYVASKGTRYLLSDQSFVLATLVMAVKRPANVSQLPEIAQPFLRALAEKSGETVFVSTLDSEKMEAVYMARAESAHPIRFMASIGERRPLFSSAGGRTLLAYLPRERQEAYLKSLRPVAFTNKTVTDKRELRRMLDAVRDSGLSATHDDTHLGVSAFGTPIHASGGEVVAALVVAAPSERIEPKSAQMVTLLREHAQALSRALGYNGT